MRRLFVLRPEPGATQTLERARAIGLDAVAVPLFAIEAVAWSIPGGPFDALLLTSANAVRQLGDRLAAIRSLPVHAVGDATAQVARAAGLEVVTTGNGDVDDLLAMVDPGLRLLHPCGENRRIATRPKQAITSVPVYRSRALAAPDGLTLAGQVAVIHSPRAGARLAELVPAKDRANVRLAAISGRAAEAAGDGWERVEIACRPDDSQLLALAARLCDKPDPQ